MANAVVSVTDGPIPANFIAAGEVVWQQRVGALTDVPALLRQLGVEPASVLVAAGLDASVLQCAENTIPYTEFGLLIDEAVQLTRCECFGLLVGQTWSLSAMGLVGQLIHNSATLGDGLRLAIAYHYLNSQGGVAFLRERGAVAEFGYAIYQRGVRGGDQIHDGALAAILNYMRELCGSGWAPTEVLLAHAPPADVGPYRRLFKSPVRFNSGLYALRFPARLLHRPLAGANPKTLRALERQADELPQPDLIAQLNRSLRVLLLSGVSSGDAIAELLTMHRRTLNRRLKAQGITFREVLDDVRFEVACQLLAGTQMVLDEVASALGYAGVSPFTRAFRRRSGTSPGQWRKMARSGDCRHAETPG